ncbi:putative cation-transporting ATPase I domain protein [Mycobacterium xenopi 4042]|uniref:Putative cation-transporting ATPase I domain protein n=1 Tax=Mycobacterium xenopi 4042 TaxID=1299334 RepID=X8CML8_MYCXE|nr:putative cation-transporting ATPase I domain protein [Mycobacterium xenopi 4042]
MRILSALPAARRVSETGVHLAQGGSTLAGLIAVTGQPGKPTRWRCDAGSAR